MKLKFLIFQYLLISLVVSCQTNTSRHLASLFHISTNTQQLVSWETKANAISTRSDELIRVEHYDIPVSLLEQDFEQDIDENLKNSIIFTRDGKKYVRWLINPEDTKWHLEIRNFLQKNNLDSRPKTFFDGYLTASRSMILVNPENGATFSLKVSTNQTGGKWSDKKHTWVDAQQVRDINKYIKNSFSKMKTSHLVIMDEPLSMGIKELNMGMTMRSLNDLPSDKFNYIPVFSIMHENEGMRIAQLNGSNNPVEFWTKHLVEPLAYGMAEFFAMTGAWYDSPHAQNFLVELDNDMKPTGRIVLRDLGDSNLLKEFVENTNYAWLLKNWVPEQIFSGKIPTAVGFLHGNQGKSWLRGLEYKEYGWNFYNFFEKKFAELSGIPVNELMKTDSSEVLYSYTRKVYPTQSESWKRFTKFANCMNGESRSLAGEKCPERLIKLQFETNCVDAAKAIINH